MAETLAPGRASAICATMSSTGQSLHRAAISKKVADPGFSTRAWTSRMSAIAMASSFSPVGWSTPATRNVLPPEATVPPGPLSRSAAVSEPRRTSPFPRGSVPRTFHQGRPEAVLEFDGADRLAVRHGQLCMGDLRAPQGNVSEPQRKLFRAGDDEDI